MQRLQRCDFLDPDEPVRPSLELGTHGDLADQGGQRQPHFPRVLLSDLAAAPALPKRLAGFIALSPR